MIAGDLPAQAGEAVLEIGPGHGALTEHLLDRAVQLTAVEIDEQCVEFLEQKFQGRENFRIENIDFLKFDLQAFLESADMVKFAGVKATPEMADAATESARGYLKGDAAEEVQVKGKIVRT